MNTRQAAFGFVLSAIIACGLWAPIFAAEVVDDTADDDTVEKARNLPETPEDKNFVREQLAHNKGVVGLKFEIRSGRATYPKVSGLVAGGPAEKAGLKVGDWITHVRDESTYGLDRDSVAFLFSGKAGDEVFIAIKRPPKNEPHTYMCVLVDVGKLADGQFVDSFQKQQVKSTEKESELK